MLRAGKPNRFCGQPVKFLYVIRNHWTRERNILMGKHQPGLKTDSYIVKTNLDWFVGQFANVDEVAGREHAVLQSVECCNVRITHTAAPAHRRWSIVAKHLSAKVHISDTIEIAFQPLDKLF